MSNTVDSTGQTWKLSIMGHRWPLTAVRIERPRANRFLWSLRLRLPGQYLVGAVDHGTIFEITDEEGITHRLSLGL